MCYVIYYNICFFINTRDNNDEVTNRDNKLIITKRKGEDGHKTFSIRIRDELVEKLDALAQQTNRSRNDLINTLLTYAIEHCEVKD